MGHCRLLQDDRGRGGLFGGGCGSLLCYEQKPQAPDIIFWAGGDGGGLGLFGGDGLGLLVGVNGAGLSTLRWPSRGRRHWRRPLRRGVGDDLRGIGADAELRSVLQLQAPP